MTGMPTDSREDAELHRRLCERRDGEALTGLIARHMPRLRALAWRMLGDAEAEDVVQDVFLRLWERPEAWDPAKGTLAAWLTRLAANAAIDRLRRRHRRDEVGLPPALPAEGPDPENEALRNDLAGRVRAAVQSLPERQRLALTLSHDLGHGNGEIAGIMGISVEAVESLLARARRTLRRRLAAELDELLERDGPAVPGEEP
jgi:RNA polymerase sigma-70 factor (ECF subfamily)